MQYTLGCLVTKYREQLGMTKSQFCKEARLSGTVLDKIEKGTTRHPEIRTIKKIIDFLKIPFSEFSRAYIQQSETKKGIIEFILSETLKLKDTELIHSIIEQYVLVANPEASISLHQLIKIAEETNDRECAATLYSSISKQAMVYRENEIMARALMREYLLMRDFVEKDTFYLGKRLIEFAYLLPIEERLEAYYRVGVHAQFIRRFKESNEILTFVINHGVITKWTEKSFFVIYNNFIKMNDVACAEQYLNEYIRLFNKAGEPHVLLDRALIVSKKGEYQQAILLLTDFVSNYPENINTIIAVNELTKIYIKLGRAVDAQELFSLENTFNEYLEKNISAGPFYKYEYGIYLGLKARVLFILNNAKEGGALLLKSIRLYAKMKMKTELLNSLQTLLTLTLANGRLLNDFTNQPFYGLDKAMQFELKEIIEFYNID
ncbi:helix-turn-helix transcriptional regulator [Brevibacillus laterosporus]|uniref:helix-turn-helix domain-containing protein n=1 Tax=Brevibacillus laterosporus TaxID=1465 RepID=UPI00215BDC37|nr:helix-turn-helix transcriptional regulator [Brevibacillus laterosporus]MCR8939806.1 helix-turn-helix transcriptional regulator [Brevibacillus laterosporus]MCZ0842446.1 helix-turn-helix transcriptional regulator [Brevibacillus laterosporus]MCZ0846443.1 helix-turn-helix transcriptional regulator [Brevibacillus laterosporus]